MEEELTQSIIDPLQRRTERRAAAATAAPSLPTALSDGRRRRQERVAVDLHSGYADATDSGIGAFADPPPVGATLVAPGLHVEITGADDGHGQRDALLHGRTSGGGARGR